MRFFFISPQQKIPVLILVVKQFPNLMFSPNVLHFETFRVIFFVFSLHTHSSSCQLGKCTRKLLLIPLIAIKSGNALELPVSWISLNTSIVLGAAVAEWLSSWLAEQEDRGSIPGLATWIFRDWLSPASKSRYG